MAWGGLASSVTVTGPLLGVWLGQMSDIWSYFGLDKKQFPERLIDSEKLHRDLLIVGTGRNVWEETRGLPQMRHVMCVNDMGMYWPGYVRHWYSNDVEQLIHWDKGRRRAHVTIYGNAERLHSCTERTGPEYANVSVWPMPSQGGSGITAILVALALGYDNITVAGIPLDNSGHFYDPPNNSQLRFESRPWTNFEHETTDRIIERTIPLMKHKVYPLSGRLREALAPYHGR